MPIVNGAYVPETLGDSKSAQERVFGFKTSRDMSDYSAAAYNYLMKQQEQAYNLQLWNLMNEYNSPAAQMKRYQDAGLNPSLIYGQSNEASSPQSASATQFRSAGTMTKGIQQGLAAVGQVMNTVKSARDTYDYWKYGTKQHQLENVTEFFRGALAKNQADAAGLELDWMQYLMGSPDAKDYSNTPRGQMYKSQKDAVEARIDQVRQIISASLTGQARTDALTELDRYRLSMMKGQNDAILNLHTGLGDEFDSFLKALIYLFIQKM